MRLSWLTSSTALSLCVVLALASPASATPSQTVRNVPATAQKPTTKPKPSDAKPTTAKPATTSTATAQAKKDRPGKRFWSRIMGAFRDVHSAEKKPK